MMPRRSKSPSSHSVNTKQIKFCHYKNGMYMGEMKCFEREGRGIVLLDTGEAAVVSYQKDKLHGEVTLFSKANQMYSLTFDHNNLVQLAAKDKHKLIYIKLKHGVPEGQMTLIDFQNEEILYIMYKQGRIIGKTLEHDNVFLNRVFVHNNLSTLIPIHHLKSLDFEFKIPHLDVIKRNSSITIGFHKQGFLNGLGFVLFKDTERENGWYEMLEKGYYKNSQLFGIGEKRYQNGNIYIGEFSGNVFQGRGLLVNTQKNNWVKGLFKDGNMVDMFEYSNEISSQSPRISEMLGALHKKKSSWISSELKFHKQIDFNVFFDKITKEAREHQGDGILDFQQRKVMALKKIQDNFVPSNSSINILKQSTPPKLSTMRFTNNTSQKKSVSPFEISSSRQKSIIKLFPPNKESRAKNVSFKKSSSFMKTPQKTQKSEIEEQEQKWKNKTNQVPINIYTFEQSSPSIPRHTEREHEDTFSSQNKYNFSVNLPSPNRIQESQSKRSISGSRRHKIFDESPSRLKVLNSSRLGSIQSPSKSSIRQNRNIGESSASEVLQQVGNPVSRSRKIVKSRILQQNSMQQDEQLPTFRYSRFRTEQQLLNTSAKKQKVF